MLRMTLHIAGRRPSESTMGTVNALDWIITAACSATPYVADLSCGMAMSGRGCV